MFHGIAINKEEIILDGSEAPVRIDAEALLSSEKLAPAAILNKVKYSFGFLDDVGWNCSFCFRLNKYKTFLFGVVVCYLMLQFFMFILQIRVPYRPVDAKLSTLIESRDKLPSGKQTLALTLTYVTVLLTHTQ